MSSDTLKSISGKVHYLPRIGLSPNSTLYVSLQDISLIDGPGKELARQVTRNAETEGLNFTLTYRAADFIPGHTYAIRASITDNDRLAFTTTQLHEVLLDVDYLQPQEVLVSLVSEPLPV
jgi:putative lipoprotein